MEKVLWPQGQDIESNLIWTVRLKILKISPMFLTKKSIYLLYVIQADLCSGILLLNDCSVYSHMCSTLRKSIVPVISQPIMVANDCSVTYNLIPLGVCPIKTFILSTTVDLLVLWSSEGVFLLGGGGISSSLDYIEKEEK